MRGGAEETREGQDREAGEAKPAVAEAVAGHAGEHADQRRP